MDLEPQAETFFPRSLLPAELKLGEEDGWWLVTEPAKWGGLPGDEGRLRGKYVDQEAKYGKLAWREIQERLVSIYGQEQAADVRQALADVKAVHDDLLNKVEQLPPERQSYYHNISRWEEASGHADQVMINAARELIGALELNELDKAEFTTREIARVLMAMAVHDADWSLADSKAEMRENSDELFNLPKDSLEEVLAVVAMVDYDTDTSSQTMKGIAFKLLANNFGESAAELVRSIVTRSDLMQVGDRNYPNLEAQLSSDFFLRKPDYVNIWKADPEKELEAKTPFYQFARRYVFSSDDPWKYLDRFFGQGKQNLAESAWQKFEDRVKKADPEGWADVKRGRAKKK